MKVISSVFIVLLFGLHINAQILDHSWEKVVFNKDSSFFSTQEAKAIAENVLLYQRDIGGWPKNIQMHHPLTEKEKKELLMKKNDPNGCTTDNDATILEMTFLSRIYHNFPDERYKAAFLKALDYLLEAQYDNGGWPQFYPLKKGYYTHITYNDNSMVNIMTLLQHLFQKDDYFSISPDANKLVEIREAFDLGVQCILKTQYVQNGMLTAWCAQHDEKTLLPAKARSYELPSLSGQESAGIVLLLMSLDNPTLEIQKAINSAVAWFEETKITGYRVERYTTSDGHREKRLIKDADAPPMWARFMELDDNTPFFCDRDGIKKPSMINIGEERRNGYAWYSTQPNKVLKKYPAWKEKWDRV